MGEKKNKVLVVCGPTATGKSGLALGLAAHFGGALIAADSMQVYRGLVVGTAATTQRQAGAVPVYMSGFLPPTETFSVANWLADTKKIIVEMHEAGKLPVVCGGTGLYIQSLVNGINFTGEPQDNALREKLYAAWEAQGAAAMHTRLASWDANRAARLHPNDKKRILRALEQCILTGQTAAEREANAKKTQLPFDTLLLGLRFENREMLYNSINARVDAMMKAGLLPEAELVWQNRAQYKTAAQAIGYKEFFPYFSGGNIREDCVEKLKQATRNYAKRQLTWFGRMPNINWLCADDPQLFLKAEKLAASFVSGQ